MWRHGHEMAEGGHMMWGTPGMWLIGILYLLGLIVFFWLMFRAVDALERIAENTEDQ